MMMMMMMMMMMCPRDYCHQSKAPFPRAVFSSAARDTVVQMDVFPQGHGAANAASREDQHFYAAG
jgi:hypothetical protein